MKLKNFCKRFFTWNRHASAGFTLVELIVVIAILAILAGVGIPVYSGYITKANKQVDITLAGDIKNALMAAYYAGDLEPGASVVVYYGEGKTVSVDPDGDGNDLGAAAAMTAAFGAGYENMTLKSDSWKDQMGVAADATMMGYVNNSNFNSNNLGIMLDQVQTVVNAASNYLVGVGQVEEGSQLDTYLTQAGIPHDSITEENKSAIANALVFVTAEELNKTDLNDTTTVSKFWTCWKRNNFEQMGWDAPTKKAASYAMVLAMATYIDGQAGTTYCKDLSDAVSGDPTQITTKQNNVLNAMKNSTGEVKTAYDAYIGDGSNTTMRYKDAMAFMGYMQGVTSSADSLLGKTDLYKDNYFNDGTVLNYVNDYISISDALAKVDAEDGAFVFVFNGETVSCLPLDY